MMDGFAEAATNNENALRELDATSAQRLTEIRHTRAIAGKNAVDVTVLVRPVSREN